MQRPGNYIYWTGGSVSTVNEWLYIYDELSHRNEAFPVDHTKLVWGLTTDVPPPSTPTPPQLTQHETPVEYLPGYTFTRTIEGWSMDVPKTEDLPGQPGSGIAGPLTGTTNQHDFRSLNLKRKFKAGTMLFRTMMVSTGISFRSYRFPVPIPPGETESPVLPPKYDLSGLPTLTLKLVYEFREEGWDKFRRVNLDAKSVGWYYIRWNRDNYADKYDPFPKTDHRIFLGEV